MSNKYIHLFNTVSEYNTNKQTHYLEPWTSLTLEDDDVNYNYGKKDVEYWRFQPLTFEILSSGNISWKMSDANAVAKTIQYKLNDGEWTNITSTVEGATIGVNKGDVVKFQGNNSQYGTSGYYNGFGSSTCMFNALGNITSLLTPTFCNTIENSKNNQYAFTKLFMNCTTLINANFLWFPQDTNNADYSYSYMFSGCSELLTGPKNVGRAWNYSHICMFDGCSKLKIAPNVLSVSSGSFRFMFRNCTSLIKGPDTLNSPSNFCFAGMFYNCINLEQAPILYGAYVQTDSATSMFYNCQKLNYIKCYWYHGLGTNTSNWLYGVSSSGTFVKHNDAQWSTGVSGIPEGWTIETIS